MLITATIDNVSVNFRVYNLCSGKDYGDYEGFPDKELKLDLQEQARRLDNSGYLIDGINESICLAHRNELELTIFPSGRVILEHVTPDNAEHAFQLLAEALPLESVSLVDDHLFHCP
jgi:hypothetical protein